MNIFTNSVPFWVSLLFLICMLVPVYWIAKVIKTASLQADKLNANKNRNIVLGFYAFYFLYAIIMSLTDILLVNTLPPRVILFTTLPLLVFYFAVVFRSKIYWVLLKEIPLSSLIRIHIFRFIGVFFLVAYFYDALPKTFAFIAGLGDIFTAVTAIFVANLAQRKTPKYKIFGLIWNIIGFWDIVSVLVTAILVTKHSIDFGTQSLNTIASNPFILIPAFAPATIVFLHITIFKKLKMEE